MRAAKRAVETMSAAEPPDPAAELCEGPLRTAHQSTDSPHMPTEVRSRYSPGEAS